MPFGQAQSTTPQPPEPGDGEARAPTPYTWMLTSDRVAGDASSWLGSIGPDAGRPRPSIKTLISQGAQFRLLNPEGEVWYEGYIVGEYRGTEPLEDFGRQAGCVSIQMRHEDAWGPVSPGGAGAPGTDPEGGTSDP